MVSKVLDHIEDLAGVKSNPPKRAWTSVGANGLPYLLGGKLIEKHCLSKP